MNLLNRIKVQSYVSFLIPILFAYLGFSVGKQLVIAYYDGAFVNWAALETLPTRVDQILSISYEGPTVVIQVEDGKIYRGDVELCQQKDEDCWVEATQINLDQELGSSIGPKCQTSFGAIKTLPQAIDQCASLRIEGADVFDEIHVALLEDNSVWVWRFRGGGLSLPFLNLGFLFASLTLIAGLGLGLLVILVLRRRVFQAA